MILLKRGEQAVIAVTVTEKAGGGIPYFRFVFEHDITKVIYTVVLERHGNYPERIDLFNLDVDSLLANSDEGFFSYQIFTHSTPPDQEDPDSYLVETGKMKLVGTSSAPIEYEGARRQYSTYGG